MSELSSTTRTAEQLSAELSALKGNRLQSTTTDHRPRFLALIRDVSLLSRQDPNGAMSLAIEILRVPGQKTSNIFSEIVDMVEKVATVPDVPDRRKEELLTALLDDRRFSLQEHGRAFIRVLDQVGTPKSAYGLANFLVKKANSKAAGSLKDVHALNDSASGIMDACSRYITRTIDGYKERGDNHNLSYLTKQIGVWQEKAPLLSAMLGKDVLDMKDSVAEKTAPPSLSR